MKVQVSKLQPGDYVIPAKATVKGVQSLGAVFIVDFDDKTATPPIPNVEVEVRR